MIKFFIEYFGFNINDPTIEELPWYERWIMKAFYFSMSLFLVFMWIFLFVLLCVIIHGINTGEIWQALDDASLMVP